MNRPAVLRGVLPFYRQEVLKDIFAGITLAALGIPEVMGYTKISQTPVVTGLYTMLLPMVAFAMFGASRHLVVAADSATAAILAATLATIAAPGSPEYLGLTESVAFGVGLLLLVAYAFRLGFLADFLSRSALIGLLTGVGVQVAAGELAGLLGLAKEGHGALEQIVSVFGRIGNAHAGTLAMSMIVLLVIIGSKRVAPRIPGALIAVAGAIAASISFDLGRYGIVMIGTVPSGLPSLALPPLRWGEMDQVLATAASCFVVIIAQSSATSRAYAFRYDERSDENVDLIGLAGANLAASLTGTFVVNGSPTKTEMLDEAGGRSQIANLSAAAIVLLVLLFLTRPLSFLPAAVLSSIVFMIGVKLIDVRAMRELYRLKRAESVIAFATAATVALVGVAQGIVVAVVLSLIEHVRHSYRPRTRLLTRDATGQWNSVPVAPGVFAAPGIVAYRFEANLFYANASRFMEEVFTVVSGNDPPPRWLVIDTSGIDDVDYSAAKTLLQLRAELERRGTRVAVVLQHHHLQEVLRPYGFWADPLTSSFPSLDAAVESLSNNTA